MKFFASRSSPARQLRIFKFFPSSDIQSYPVYIQSFPIHPAIAWCLIPGEGFKYKWSAGTFRYAALHWRLEDISKKRHSRVCSCWPSSTCMQFVLFLFIYKANTTSSAIWMWGPDSDKMTGTVVLGNGCRSTLWWAVFGRQQCWRFLSSRFNCDSQWIWAPSFQEMPIPSVKSGAEKFDVQVNVMNASFLKRFPSLRRLLLLFRYVMFKDIAVANGCSSKHLWQRPLFRTLPFLSANHFDFAGSSKACRLWKECLHLSMDVEHKMVQEG